MNRIEATPPAPHGQRPPTVKVVRCDQTVPVRTIAPVPDFLRFDQTKVHGAHAALTFVADETRAGEPTVTIECATRDSDSDRTYAWKEKLRFQLTPSELQLLTCLLLGTPGDLSFRNHGDKWCTFVRQTAGKYAGVVRVTMGQTAQSIVRTVAIDFACIGPVAALCLRRCAALLRVGVDCVPVVLRVVSRAYTEHSKADPKSASGNVSREDNAVDYRSNPRQH